VQALASNTYATLDLKGGRETRNNNLLVPGNLIVGNFQKIYKGENAAMGKTFTFLSLVCILALVIACEADWGALQQGAHVHDEDLETIEASHMVAEAKLTAHFVAAALAADMSTDEINAALQDVAADTEVAEIWVTDGKGNVVFTNVVGSDFKFPTDPDAGTQAAPFAALLDGSETVVVQDAQPREADGKLFRYVGVAGVDEPRIVQVGIDETGHDHEH
jgi:hypothetical protein